MLGKLTRKDESDAAEQFRSGKSSGLKGDSRGLNLTRGNGGLFVVCGEL